VPRRRNKDKAKRVLAGLSLTMEIVENVFGLMRLLAP
jgi:hypothetical protein